MDGNELLKRALALFAETDSTDEDHQRLALPYINLLLAEVFEVNNRIRRQAGKQPLAAVPELASLGETIDCEEPLLRLALPWGLAARLYFDESDDNARLNMFLQEYADRVNRCDRWVVAF